MGKGMVRVDRGDGKLLQFQPKDAEDFIKATPGAKKVKDRPAPAATTAAEDAATAASAAQETGLSAMTVPQLKAHAEEHHIDISGAAVKADIIERIEAAGQPEGAEAN